MPPINDNFASATTISTSLPQTITGQTTVDATAETGEPSAPGFGSAVPHSVWYSFTPTHDATYRFRIYNTNTVVWTDVRSLGMGVYTGAAVNALTAVETKNASSGSVSELIIRIPLTGGVTYHLMVESPSFTGEGANAHAFNFDLDVSEITSPGTPPANDDLADAEDLGTDPTGVFSGSNIDATWEAWEDSVGYDQPSVWYRFSIDYTGTQAVSLTKTGSDTDWEPYGEIYEITSDPPADFTDLSYYNYIGDNISPPGGVASTNVDWVPGDYVLIVTNWNSDGSWDDFDLEFQAPTVPPVNDVFSNRTILPSSYKVIEPGTTDNATAGVGAEFNEPHTNPGNINPPQPSIWYEWTAPNYARTPLNFQIDTEGSTAVTRLEVFTGSSLGGLTLVSSDFNSGAGGKSKLTLSATGGTNYKIRISSPAVSTGATVLNITAQVGGSPPTNDNFSGATLMTGYSDSESGTTSGASAEDGEPSWGNDEATTNTVWYKWVPPQTGRVRFQLDPVGTGGSTGVTIARGSSLATLQEVQFVELTTNGFINFDFVSVEGGVDYYFIVYGLGGYETTFTLSFDMANVSPPANDAPANATVIDANTLSGNLNVSTAGATWDTVGPYVGDFITDAQELISVWYKFIAPKDGSITIDFNGDTPYEPTYTSDAQIQIFRGSNISTATLAESIFAPGAPESVSFAAGETYWIGISTYGWVTATDIDYSFVLQEFNEEVDGEGSGFNPSPSGNSTGDFDSVTGSFVADEDDDVFVAGGTAGYGSISPWTTHGTHHPYAWYCRFELDSTQGDYVYRYGQTRQWIEVFRATKTNGDYASIGVLGHETGTQSICVFESVSGTVKDTFVKCWGASNLATSTKIVIEVGSHGVSVDGRNIDVVLDTYTDNPFKDTQSNQFIDFDFGIRSFPGDGTSYVDIDPEWNFRYSNIRIHDDLHQDVLGSPNTTIKEVCSVQGFTTGIDYPFNGADYNFFSFHQISSLNVAPIVPSPGEYDGWALDCTTDGSNLNGIGWLITNQATSPDQDYNDFVNGGGDSLFPGFSFRFYLTDFPSEQVVIGEITDGTNGCYLSVDGTGILYIRPSISSEDIPICTVSENAWNYVELQADTSNRTYATKVWLQNYYLGRFESTYTPPNATSTYPAIPPRWNSFYVGRLQECDTFFTGFFTDVSIGVLFRDLSVTRRKIDRPLGPTVVVPLTLNGVGEHNITEPDETPVNATNIITDGNFTGGVDAAGQPLNWTGYDRFDTSVPSGAHRDENLTEAFGDTLLTVVSETSGPPGFEADNALRIEIPTQNDMTDDAPGAMYEFFPGTSNGYHIFYADTIGSDFYIKGPIGSQVYIDCFTGNGAYLQGNAVVLSGNLPGGWDRVRLFIAPETVTADQFVHNLVVRFPNSSVGDVFYIKDFKSYVNPEGDWARFWASPDGGVTVEEIHEDDTDSWQYITDIPADTGGSNDVVYLNGHNFRSTLRGAQDDGKTHLPPLCDSSYLEYTWQDTDADSFYGLRLLVALSGWNDTVLDTGITDFDSFTDGRAQIVFSDVDGNYRHEALITGQKLFGVQVPHPAGSHGWTKGKWNDARVRLGMHEIIEDFGTGGISYGYLNVGVIRGIWAEALVYDRRLLPPNCARPIDLSRIRFRAFEANDID